MPQQQNTTRPNQRREKKSETIEVRVSHSEKQAFMEVCEAEGTTASSSIRSYIDRVLNPTTNKDHLDRWFAGSQVLLLLVLIFLVARAFLAPKTVEQALPVDPFIMFLDQNKDGVVSADDRELIDPTERQSFDLLMGLGDTDGDGTLSGAEVAGLMRLVVQFRGPLSGVDADVNLSNVLRITTASEQVFVLPQSISEGEIDAMIRDKGLHATLSAAELDRLKRIITALHGAIVPGEVAASESPQETQE